MIDHTRRGIGSVRGIAAGLSFAATVACALGALPTRVAMVAGADGTWVPGVAAARVSVIGSAQIDASGGVLATCRFAGGGVVFGANDLGLMAVDRFGTVRVLARTGSAAGLTPGSVTFSSTFYPRLRGDGGVATVCFLGGAGVDATNSTGYWTGTREGIAPALRSGVGSVPDVPGASFFAFAGGFPCAVGGVGGAGAAGIAFSGQMAVGVGGVTIETYQGIWGPRVDGSGGLTLIARTGVVSGAGAPPGSVGAGAVYTQLNSRSLTMAGNGRVVFGAALGSALVVGLSDTVLVERRPDGSVVVAAREGEAVPGWPGRAFGHLDTTATVTSGGVSINSAGDLAFGDLDASDPPDGGVSRLWRRRASGVFDLVAARGAASGLGTPVGIAGVFTVIQPPAIDAGGRMVFAGEVLTSGGATVAGMWMLDAGASEPRLIVRSDFGGTAQSPPLSAGAGARFSAELPPLGTYRMNARGQVVFRWKLQVGAGGVTSAAADGVWAYDPAMGLMSVVRAGDVIALSGGQTGAVSAISGFYGPGGGDDGRIRDVNDAGEVAYCVQFGAGGGASGALLVSQLPGVGACCRGGTCAVVGSEMCVGANTRFAGLGTMCVDAGGVEVCCKADFNQSGVVNAQDIFAFLGAWFARDSAADVDGDGSVAIQDMFAFLEEWFGGC